MRTMRIWAAVAALPLLVALTLVGCGQNKPPICSDVKALQTSVDNLKKVDVRASGLPALSNQAQHVRDDVSRVIKDARSEYQPQIDGMKSAVARLSSSISTAKADPTAATLSAVRSSVRDVGTAFTNLQQAVSGTC